MLRILHGIFLGSVNLECSDRIFKARMQQADRVAELRRSLSDLNLQILGLLNQRATVALALSEAKHAQTPVVYDPEREEEMIGEIRRHNGGPFSNEELELVFRQLFEVTRWLMRDSRDPHTPG